MHGRAGSAGHAFLAGQGELAARMRGLDWSGSPVGPPDAWPQSLRTVVSLMLNSKFPMFVAWGPELGFLYNDAYADILGAKHPSALGRRFEEIWVEIWDDIAPLIDRALAGEATFQENLRLFMDRRGYREETYFTFSYSPVRDEGGDVAGMFCTCIETTETVLGEARLRASEARVRSVLEGMDEGFVLLDSTFRVRQINAEGLRIDGRGREAMVGRSHWDLWPGTEQSELGDLYRRALREDLPVFREQLYAWPDGRSAWLDVRAYPNPEGLAIFYRDITARKEAEAALQESEARFRNLADNAPVMVWVTDAEGACTYLSRSWYTFTGQSEPQGLGLGWLDAVHPDDRGWSGEVFLAANARCEAFRLEYRLRRADGAYRWAIDAAGPCFAEDGTFLGYVGSVLDIHDRKLAEERLAETTRRLDAVLDNATQAIFMMDERQHCAYMNRAAERLTGYTLAETQGRPLHDVVHHTRPDGSPYPLCDCPIDQAFPENDGEQGEEVFVRRDGSFYPVAFTASPIRDEAGRPVGTVVEARNIEAELRAKAELTASEENFRTLADNIPTLCWMANADGWIYWYNRRWHDYTGTTPAEMEGWGWRSVHDPERLPAVMERWTGAIASGRSFEMTFPLRGADGRFRPFLTRIDPVRDEGGRITRWFGVNIDVSERVAAEEALRFERDRSRGVLENMREGFLLLDRDFRILEINSEGLRLETRPREAMVGRSHWEVYPGSEDLEIGGLYKRALTEGVPVSLEHRYRWEDGRELWLEMRAYPAPDGATLAVFYRDVTERQEVEARIRESEARLRTILDTAPVGIVFAEAPSGRIIGGNAQAERIFGHPILPSPDVPGYSAWISHHPDGRRVEPSEYPLARAIQGEAERPEMEVLYRHGDGRDAWVRLIAAPIRADGRITGGVVAALDIDAEKRAEADLRELNATLELRIAEAIGARERVEAQLRQAQKMEAVGRLTGGIAHDFNNLLTVVLGNLEMLQRRASAGADPRLLRHVDNAMEGARRAATLTHRLLAFSRQSPLQPETVDVNKLVAGMSDLLRRTLGEEVAIETVLAAGLWRTEADPNQMESAILNLAVNARDAMPDGGRLTIETANAYLDEAYVAAAREEVKAGQFVLVAVCDTGTGMDPRVMERIFEPFFTTKPVGKGTGLGLAQVYGFMRQSGGHAAVYSEPGHGTTVKLYFPRLRRAADRVELAGTDGTTPDALRAAPNGITVLVVEDEPMVRDFSVAALEEAGYRVLSAGDGPNGLALLDAHPEVALLFTDVVLAGPLNGRKVADEAVRRRPDLKVLFTTGYTRNAIIHHGRLDEGVELIGKPFTASSLAAKVSRVLEAV